jgi:hypothetical protein
MTSGRFENHLPKSALERELLSSLLLDRSFGRRARERATGSMQAAITQKFPRLITGLEVTPLKQGTTPPPRGRSSVLGA